ncbi:MAG: membrane protein insertase YidC [Candidatus Omnitrophica bacterium]|nr:membrane protein insertase YidC [Candidatus Omnitrophota bacterium]
MGKKTLLAFSLSLLVIIGYNYYLAQRYPRQEIEISQDRPASLSPAPAEKAAKLEIPATDSSKISSLDQASSVSVETDLLTIVITSSGARIKSCQLKNYPEEKVSLPEVNKQLAQLNQQISAAPEEAKPLLRRQKEKLELLVNRMEQEPTSAEMVSLAAQLDADYAPTILLPGNELENQKLNSAIYSSSKNKVVLSGEEATESISFVYRDARGRSIEKTYSFSNSSYIIELDIIFSGWAKADLEKGNFLLFLGPDIGLPQIQRGRRMQAYNGPITYFDNGQQQWVDKEKYSRQEEGEDIQRAHDHGKVLWAGLVNKYFIKALIPDQGAESVLIEKNKVGEHKVALSLPWTGNGTYRFRLYMGPKKESRLGQADVSLEKSIDYGFFGPIARFIYLTLVFFSKWTGNFGWAIILLCIATKVVLYPFTHRSFESMQRMQEQMKSIQPEMDALRVKYKDNPQKLNKELMEFYHKKGINPLASCQSGCLPLILQMPVFFALYVVLYNSIELRGAHFIGWIKDLSAMDPYYILPILMGISMFIQQKLTGMGTTGGAQQEQAKMMSIMFPILLTWIFASLPSGVVLYWFIFNLVTSLQQLLIKKKSQVVAVVT